MFAVIRTSGRQYRVAADDVIEIDRVSVEIGQRIDFAEVLMLGGESVKVGAPLVEGAMVAGEVLEHPRGPKVIAFKKRRRKNSKRKRGHRQLLTLVRITDILTDGKKPSAKKAAKKKTEEHAEAPKTEATKAEAPKAEVAAEEAAPAVMFTPPAGEPSDLKQLTGVGPAIERKFNSIGITHYKQIAALKAADIAKVEEALHLKGRFERDGWVAEAKALAKGGKA